MKPIPMSLTRMAERMTPAPESVSTRATAPRESFEARLALEVNYSADSAGQGASLSAGTTRNMAVQDKPPGEECNGTPEKMPGEAIDATIFRIEQKHSTGGELRSHAALGAIETVSTRPKHTPAVTQGGEVKKRISKGNREGSSSLFRATASGNDASRNGDGSNVLTKTNIAERVFVPSKPKDPVAHFSAAGSRSSAILQPGSSVPAYGAPGAPVTAEGTHHGKTDLQGTTISGLANAPKGDKEFRSVAGADAGLLAANGLRTGTANAVSITATPQAVRSFPATIETGAQPRHVSAGGGLTTVAPQTVISTPTRLDVGVFNGTHGWLRVRAELGPAGAVTASVTAIGAAHEALRSAVPEIARYLSVEAVKVGSIEVHRYADGAGALLGTDSDGKQSGGEQGNDSGEGAPRQPSAGIPEFEPNNSSLAISGKDMNVEEGRFRSGSKQPAAPILLWSGGNSGLGMWLNVCA